MSISSKAFPSITTYVIYEKYSITQDNDGMVTQHTKYNFKNIPTDLMNTDDTYSEICPIFNKFEVIKQEQKCINDIYI